MTLGWKCYLFLGPYLLTPYFPQHRSYTCFPPHLLGAPGYIPSEMLHCFLLEDLAGRWPSVICWWSCARDEAPQKESRVSSLTLPHSSSLRETLEALSSVMGCSRVLHHGVVTPVPGRGDLACSPN